MFCVLVSFLIAHWLWWGCCVWWLLSGVYSFTLICGLYVARTFFGCFDCFAGVFRLVCCLGFGLLLGFACLCLVIGGCLVGLYCVIGSYLV